jgi:transglutaminase-like putative cysteine protease
MYVRIGYDLLYDVLSPQPILMMLLVHPERTADLTQPERIITEPHVRQEIFNDAFGNRAVRIVAPKGRLRLTYDNVIRDSGLHEQKINGARLHRVEELPTECLQFLMSSRYCEVDRLSQLAWDLFGTTPPTWERVQAVMNWVHDNVTFGYEFASSTKTAQDVCNDKRGVCRDFQHLAITLLRALNIPTRYATGYLGDIGVPPNPLPMDFSAWLEVYLGNRWYALDARHNEPRIARILMARGRDATDVALTTSFGPTALQSFRVWTDQVPAPQPVSLEDTDPVPSDMVPSDFIPLETPSDFPVIVPAHAQTAATHA